MSDRLLTDADWLAHSAIGILRVLLALDQVPAPEYRDAAADLVARYDKARGER